MKGLSAPKLSLFAALFLGGCMDYNVEGTKDPVIPDGPVIEVSPVSLEFGNLESGINATQVFTISSVGDTTLTINMIRMEGSGSFSLTAPVLNTPLESGDSMDVVVNYTSAGVPESGIARVYSDDAATPEVPVTLTSGALTRDLVITPNPLDMGATAAGAELTDSFTLSNAGTGILTLSDFSVADSRFAVTSPVSWPMILEPGATTNLDVAFTPPGVGIYTTELSVVSDDPVGVETAAIQAEGAGGPIAVCSVTPNPVGAIHESATWIGEESYDVAGHAILRYNWTLTSKPPGSDATMPGGTGANRTGFIADMVGEYTAQLVVTNDIGQESEPCYATLEAIPTSDLWVEMFWTYSGDDMDLHLVAPGGSLVTATDCYYGNCTYTGLDWGVPGDPDDDPVLDIDDIPGTGPENINVGDPQDGTFGVWVHDYPGSVYTGRNDVTVNVYIGGVLTWTDTRDVNSEGTYFHFCDVEWPSGIVTDRTDSR